MCIRDRLKAVRNDREIAGIHAAMQRDGVALVKFLKWLEEALSLIHILKVMGHSLK